ncbi:LysR family transcriptional regulator [uncultured Tateyamaria sp.]|uniref:LysR family transcriptional regulator n=1 Tax=uncultured Tateyamaria sp. TaxID=455651 RepID=UPI002609608F|nr:LysR family transcriptional regulator [uncultured Tateyamaria sp.]
MDWNDLRFFLSVARTGSLSSAAKELNASASTVSRRIEQLEATLQIALFTRHQSGYLLTDDGNDLMEHANRVEDSVGELEMSVVGRDRQPEGLVRLATAENLANFLIIPELGPFSLRYPKITLEIVTGIERVNPSKHEADIAVRLVRPTRGNVKVQRVAVQKFGLYASKSFLELRYGDNFDRNFQRQPDDRWIVWADDFSHLPTAELVGRILAGQRPSLITHSVMAQVMAAKAGLGMAVLPCLLGDMHSDLIRLRFEGEMTEQEIWLVTQQDLVESARVKAVSGFVRELFERNRDRLYGAGSKAISS